MSSVVQKNVKCGSKSQKFLIAGEIPEIVKAVARLPENTRCLLQLPIAAYDPLRTLEHHHGWTCSYPFFGEIIFSLQEWIEISRKTYFYL